MVSEKDDKYVHNAVHGMSSFPDIFLCMISSTCWAGQGVQRQLETSIDFLFSFPWMSLNISLFLWIIEFMKIF